MTDGPVAPSPTRELSYGEKAVGLSFNPSQDPAVYACKSGFAHVIPDGHLKFPHLWPPKLLQARTGGFSSFLL